MSYEGDLLQEISKHKNWTRFDPSRLIGAAAFFTMVLVAFAMSGGIGMAFNLPSFIMCVGGMISLSMVAFGVERPSHAIGLMVRVLFPVYASSDAFDKGDVRVFRGMIASLYASGAIGFFIGVIQMLAQLDDPSAIGAGMAVALLCPLYSLLMAEGLLRPMAYHLEDKLSK